MEIMYGIKLTALTLVQTLILSKDLIHDYDTFTFICFTLQSLLAHNDTSSDS